MLTKLGLADLYDAVKTNVEAKTGIPCHETSNPDTTEPFYFVEFIKRTPGNTKTMFCETYTVWFHPCMANDGNSIFTMLQKADEALTDDIVLPADFELLGQIPIGLQQAEDENNRHHTVLVCDFKIAYPFKTKT